MQNQLHTTLKELMQDPKGLLAADESNNSAQKRFEALRIPCDSESRRLWRQLLCTTPNISNYISGVIFYDETISQITDSGLNFAELLQKQGIIPGIKVDKGLIELENFKPETFTQGLDDLQSRLENYYDMGARFTKWRSAFQVGVSTPSEAVIKANLNIMAIYASLAQAQGMVPIVEPEVLYDGNHSIEASADVTSRVIDALFDLLSDYKVDLGGVILKTSMVLAGKGNDPSKPEQVADYTLKVLNRSVPREVGGIVFLSGGQAPLQATANLNAIGQAGSQPWPITYSFSRAVQDDVMKLWRGKPENVVKAQKKFAQNLAQNSAARNGEFAG